MEKLEVGDRVYVCYREKINKVLIIDRVTKTQAIAGNHHRFRREYSSNFYLYKIGDNDRWSLISYRIEDDQLKEKYIMQVLKDTVQSIKVDELSKEQLSNIIDIVNG